MIYFIEGDDDLIKIGTTIRLTQRLRALAYESKGPLRVLAVMAGSYREEKALHRRFDHHRIPEQGEWFHGGRDLLKFIEEECHEWDGSDEAGPDPYTVVRIREDIVEAAKLVALSCKMNLSDYLSDLLEAPVLKDRKAVIRKLASEEKEDR